jgi:hypothetical protein
MCRRAVTSAREARAWVSDAAVAGRAEPEEPAPAPGQGLV